jgi:hypothetical protein
MTDTELLEAAAKAAGIAHEGMRFRGQGEGWGLRLAGTMALWNPLTDDGDALRLAVQLRIIVLIYVDSTSAVTARGSEEVQNDSDPYAATRRAIVRAAALKPGEFAMREESL